jgi:hypothetical protein
LSSPTPHRYDHPFWEFGDILGWLMDRDPKNFGRFRDIEDYRQERLFGIAHGKSLGQPLLCRNPRQVLLHALQRGQLTAYRGSSQLDKVYWSGKTVIDVLNGLRDFVAERDEVLRLWRPLSQRQRPSDEDLDRWMSENVRPGAKRDQTIADCREAIGATVRAAIEAWSRLPADKRLKRGQKPPRPGQIER